MSAWTNGIYTRRGLALLSKLTQGSSLKITKAVIGTGYVDPYVLSNQTEVSGTKQNLLFKTASYPENGVCKLPMFVTNKGLTSGYVAKQVGLYAMDPDLGEILYFISQSEHGTEIPSESIMPDYSAVWTFYFRYGQAENVDVTVDASHTITEDMLNEVRIIAETGVSAPKSGEALALSNTANLPFASLRLFGKTTQNGTPSIDNPVDLESVQGTVNVRVFGKNLLDPSITEGTVSGITRVKNTNGSITINGTATETHGLGLGQITLYDGTYIVSGGMTGAHLSVWGKKKTTGEFVNVVTDSGSGAAFVADSTLYTSYLIQYHINGEAKFSNSTLYPMVRIASFNDANFEKYKPVQTQTFSFENNLAGIPVSSGGNYTDANGQQWICDEIDFARGVLIQRIKCVTYNGSEVWEKSGTNSYYVRANDSKRVQPMCDKLGPKTTDADPYIKDGTTGDGVNAIIVSLGEGAVSSVDDLKAAISQNNLTVLYALSTPVEIQLTDAEITAFNALVSNNPHTTIINDGGANIEADCFLAQHEAAFKRVIALANNRIASGTEDLIAGESKLETGKLYVVYE